MTVKCLMLAVVVGLSATLAATESQAQSHSLMLEQAIFAEDTAGDLDGAIRMYERLASTPGAPDEIVRMARERLATVSARRNQRTQVAAAQQAKPTGRPGQVDPAPAGPPAVPPAGTNIRRFTTLGQAAEPLVCCGMFSNNYDPNRFVVITGTVTSVQWVNPLSFLIIQGTDGNRWGFTLESPSNLIRQGLTRNSPKVGEEVTVSGFLARGTPDGCQGPLPHACATLADGSLHASASGVTSTADGRQIFARLTPEQAREVERERATNDRILREEAEKAAGHALLRLNDPLPLLSFSNASVRDILKAVGLLAGINVTFDGNYVDPRPYSVGMKGTTLEQALNMVTTQNRLSYKVLDERTILISNDTSPKR
jgi:hypothetical protein